MAYEKQQWDTTSFVNPTRMNHIEEGIKANSDEVTSLNNDLANTKKDVSDLNSNLSLKCGIPNYGHHMVVIDGSKSATWTATENGFVVYELVGGWSPTLITINDLIVGRAQYMGDHLVSTNGVAPVFIGDKVTVSASTDYPDARAVVHFVHAR